MAKRKRRMLSRLKAGKRMTAENRNFLRFAKVERKTNETDVSVFLNIDGTGKIGIKTGSGMLDHMLTLIFFWAEMDLDLHCQGDFHVDSHHSFEDIGLVLGTALNHALADKIGIARAAFSRVPMDEALADVIIDLSGRPWLEWRGEELLPPVIAGDEKDVWREFYKSFASAGKLNLHVNFQYGKNGHHLLESAAKGLGLALKGACARNFSGLKSTKGEID